MNAFAHRSSVLTVPRLVTTEPVHKFSSPLARDLFALGAEMMQAQKQHNLDAEAEVLTEGHTWKNRTNFHND